MRALWLLGAWLWLGATATAGQQEHWQSLRIDGLKVGHARLEIEQDAERVVHRSVMTLRLTDRNGGESLRLDETQTESAEGQPISLRWARREGSLQTTIRASYRDGRWQGERRRADARERFDLPAQNLRLDGGLALGVAELLDGTRATLRLQRFDPEHLSLSSWQLRLQPQSRSGDTDPDLIWLLARRLDGSADREQRWPWRLSSQRLDAPLRLNGQRVERVKVDRATALADNDDFDLLSRTLIDSPYRFPAHVLGGRLRYVLVRRDGQPLDLPATDEQQIHQRPGRTIVTVCRDCGLIEGGWRTVSEADLASTDWIQSRDVQIRRLAHRGERRNETLPQTMQRLVRLTQQQLSEQITYSEYASAADALRRRRGDCTEYALLLAALTRALGIPTRVVYGIAYASRFTGASHVFSPHMWVQIHDGERWHSYDAGLGQFDAGHIVLALGDGSPTSFQDVMALIGQLQVVDAAELVDSGESAAR